MICSLFECGFLGFMSQSIRAMGCFFGCFRIRDDRRHPQTHLVSEPLPSKLREPVVSRNPLSSLLLADDKDGLPCKDKTNPALRTPEHGNNNRELKDEARFLKACGTLLETPPELREGSGKFKDLSCDGDSEASKFHSWLPNTSIEKLKLEKQPDQPPTPINLSEKRVKGLDSLEQTPSSSTQDSGVGSVTNQISSTATSSVTPGAFAANVQCRPKSVRFECEDDVISFSSRSSSSEIASQNLKQPQSAGNYSASKLSPYPTPLKLTDEMQTPGTVFPGYLENMANTKNPRIRSQYVYSVQNPIENLSEWKVLKEEDSNSHQQSDHVRETSVEKEFKVEGSLSSWLKPASTNQDGNNQSSGSISIGKAHLHRTPGDRPIIGMVAAHWNEDEPTRISPKYWDGNGIPNSTNKYKEDQKVSWHATPFEERLEKALSNETSVFQRKPINGTPPIAFEETEESDTAISQLQSSTHAKPVVSC
ncbi:Protein JASON [Camellia lanceoleosa]|uniref:Protein JASON n=1 Tax=Camellia lanceoleosa TaxID=1840588 RepID=A0ACC0H3J8_9ERIC|nr:Protein JASON [Camellia lanceoleosa]